MSRKQYVLTRPVRGALVRAVGEVVELTPKQAASPLWRLRCRPVDSGRDQPHMVVGLGPDTTENTNGATGPEGGSTHDAPAPEEGFDWERYRDGFLEELQDAGIDYDPDAPAEELASLLDEQIREAVVLAAQ